MMRVHVTRLGSAFLTALLIAGSMGCVRKSTHNAVLGQLADAQRQAALLEDELEAAAAARAQAEVDLQLEIAEVQEELARTRSRLTSSEDALRRTRDQALTAENEGRRLNTLLNQRGDEAQLLRSRLEALSAVEREIRERNRIYEDVIQRFRSLIEGGQLSVSIIRGRMVINLPQDILFRSGSAVIEREGQTTLTQVGEVLAQIGERRFLVEGHTDNVPIATARFPSNWELSTARALSVVRLLQSVGVPPENLSGAGFGEYQPVASNDEAEGRRLNRRIEIVMLPNLDVISQTQLPARQG